MIRRTFTSIIFRQSKPITSPNIKLKSNPVAQLSDDEYAPYQTLSQLQLPVLTLPAIVRPVLTASRKRPQGWNKHTTEFDYGGLFAAQIAARYGNRVTPQAKRMYLRVNQHASVAAKICDPLYGESPDHSRTRMLALYSWIMYRRLVDMLRETRMNKSAAPLVCETRSICSSDNEHKRLQVVTRAYFEFVWFDVRAIRGVDENIEDSQLRLWKTIELLSSGYETMRATNDVTALHGAIWMTIYPMYPVLDRAHLDVCVELIKQLCSDSATWTNEQMFVGDFKLSTSPSYRIDDFKPLRWDQEGAHMLKALLHNLSSSTSTKRSYS